MKADSVLCAVAHNIQILLVGRVIQGLGAGGQLGLVNVTISDLIAVRYGVLISRRFRGNEEIFAHTKYHLENGACILATSGLPGLSHPRLARYWEVFSPRKQRGDSVSGSTFPLALWRC